MYRCRTIRMWYGGWDKRLGQPRRRSSKLFVLAAPIGTLGSKSGPNQRKGRLFVMDYFCCWLLLLACVECS
jgi:hypothetical protein